MKTRTSLAKKPNPATVADLLVAAVREMASAFGLTANLGVNYILNVLQVSFVGCEPMELFTFAELGIPRFEREFRSRMIGLIDRAKAAKA